MPTASALNNALAQLHRESTASTSVYQAVAFSELVQTPGMVIVSAQPHGVYWASFTNIAYNIALPESLHSYVKMSYEVAQMYRNSGVAGRTYAMPHGFQFVNWAVEYKLTPPGGAVPEAPEGR